ncbi:MAG: 3-oxoacyl-[acyl-carrier protein] reductase [Solirubrobacterales bacterium]|jgi:3-oxoacyl-[acyl-carrier protein] reductase|nr:3-oxoacyl-[acyl-carrier protein] reductase [Solirubrobacterales bacterium]HWC09376.1 SDR family oxidoreductase [Solirubrobacterales bacterium]
MTDRPISTVLVTAGAGAGIGSAIVRTLADEGWDVVITDAHERRTKELAAELSEKHDREFLGYTLDVADFEAVGEVVAEVVAARGGIHALVNSAGWNKLEPLIEMDPETWQRCLDVDLTGSFNCMRHVLPVIRDQGGGAVVNISSIAAWESSTEHGAAYSAAKAGVTALTRVAAAELGEHNIRVNAIAPGLIYNDFLLKVYPKDFFEGYADRRSKVGRVGHPDDIAALTAFLLGDKAGYITGETYGVSGGVFPHA